MFAVGAVVQHIVQETTSSLVDLQDKWENQGLDVTNLLKAAHAMSGQANVTLSLFLSLVLIFYFLFSNVCIQSQTLSHI